MPNPRDDSNSQTGSAQTRRSLAVWIWSILLVGDLLLITRRMGGGFATPLSGLRVLLSGITIAVLSFVAWLIFKSGESETRERETKRVVAPAISMAATLMWCGAIAGACDALTAGILIGIVLLQAILTVAHEPAISEWAEALLGTLSVSTGLRRPNPQDQPAETAPSVLEERCRPVGESASNRPTLIREASAGDAFHGGEATFLFSSQKSAHPVTNPVEISVEEDDSDFEWEEQAPAGDDVTLWLSRRITELIEQVEGWVRVDFAPGLRETVVHVAFCPPLSGIPQIETEDLEGSGVEIRVAAAFAFGARLSVRRSGDLSEAATVRVGFIAEVLLADRAA